MHGDFYDRMRTGRVWFIARVARIIDALFSVLYTLLLVRFALELFGARSEAGFFQFIRRWSEPFYAPFRGLFETTAFDRGHVVWSLLVAVFAYGILHGVIRALLRALARA
jgi:uncharacterized protein YggT (Ycf19 family)